jgi:hypothetical protein
VFQQNNCGLRGRKKDELLNSLFPGFPHVLCFSELNFEQVELEQINLEGYKVEDYFCSNVDQSIYCKERDIETCALKLELTALNIYIDTLYRAACGNFISFLNGLDSIIKSLFKFELNQLCVVI